MKRWQRIVGMLGVTFIGWVTGCTQQQDLASVEAADAGLPEKTAKTSLSLVSGEIYSTSTDQACQKHEEEGMYLCLSLMKFPEDPPNIWRANICKWIIADGGPGITPAKYKNSPIRWRVRLPGTQITQDFFFESTEEWASCTPYEQVDLKGLPCEKQTVMDAEVLSPADCNQPGCSYPTGAFLTTRFCPAGASSVP